MNKLRLYILRIQAWAQSSTELENELGDILKLAHYSRKAKEEAF